MEIQYIKGLRVCVVVFFRCIRYRFIDEQSVGLSCEGDDPGDQRWHRGGYCSSPANGETSKREHVITMWPEQHSAHHIRGQFMYQL